MRASRFAIAFPSIFLACGAAPAAPPNSVQGAASGGASDAGAAAVSTTASAPIAPSSDAADASATPREPELPPVIAEIQREALKSTGAADTVQSLTTEVGSRLAGSPGDAKAVAWAIRAMTARGLTNVHAEAITVPHWERGAESAAIVSPFPHKLAVTALGGSVPTPNGRIEGDVVRLESLEALTAIDKKEVAGKIVFIDKPMRRAKDGTGYGETVGARSRGPLEAAKKGAIALLIRSIGTDHERLPHTGHARRDKNGHNVPAAALSAPDAELLAHVIETSKTARVSLTISARWLPDAKSANVVGEVRGREAPDDVVLIGAHLDSWDLATGAVDDGAGCGIVLEAGRILSALDEKPKRTVRVVLFAAEENALAGGIGYAKAHANDAAHHIVAFEADAGTDKVYTARYLGAPGERARFAALMPRIASLDVTLDTAHGSGGADVGPLRALGVPVIDFEQDFTRYFDWHHSANDTFDKIDAKALSQASAVFATMAYSFAEMDGDFGRVPDADREDKH